MHLAGAVAFRLVLLHNLGPQHTGGTELGNLHEVVLAHAHVELDVLGCEGRLYAHLHHLVQVFVAPGQSVSQLLVDVGTAVVQCDAVHSHAPEVRVLLQCVDQLGSEGENGSCVLAFYEDFLNRVPVDAAAHLLLVVTLLLEISNEQLGQLK